MNFLPAGQKQEHLEIYYEDRLRDIKKSETVFIANSPIMQRLHQKIKELAFLSSPVLILGQNGTGRTTSAYEIFKSNTTTHSQKFIKFVCYGLDQKTIEKTLFIGTKDNKALLNIGEDNTLFIKGLENLNPVLQKKFLHYLSHKEDKKMPRLICSSSESLSTQAKEGLFSQELFEILCQNLLILPSLAERSEDIPYLISAFNKQNNFKGQFTDTALQVLKTHIWNHNIVELKNVCLQISLLHSDKEFITEEELSMIDNRRRTIEDIIYNPEISLETLINYYISKSLEHFKSKKRSAKALGISVKTIYNKIKTGCVMSSSDYEA